MENKIVLITGATSGLGLEALVRLNKENVKTICLVRNKEKLKKQIIDRSLDETLIESYYYDQSNFDSIEALKESLKKVKLDGVIFNSGIYYPKEKVDGRFNKTIKTNYLGAFKLFFALKEIGIIDKKVKIVFVTSLTSKLSMVKGNICDFKITSSNNKSYAYSKKLINQFVYKLILDGYDAYLADPGVFYSGILSSGDSGFSKLFTKCGNAFLKTFLPSSKKQVENILYPLYHNCKKRYIKPHYLSIYGKATESSIPKRFRCDDIINMTNDYINLN